MFGHVVDVSAGNWRGLSATQHFSVSRGFKRGKKSEEQQRPEKRSSMELDSKDGKQEWLNHAQNLQAPGLSNCCAKAFPGKSMLTTVISVICNEEKPRHPLSPERKQKTSKTKTSFPLLRPKVFSTAEVK